MLSSHAERTSLRVSVPTPTRPVLEVALGDQAEERHRHEPRLFAPLLAGVGRILTEHTGKFHATKSVSFPSVPQISSSIDS